MSLISAASQKINVWNDQLRDSSVGRFWSWWMTELRSLLPTEWRERLVAEARPLQIYPDTDSYQLHTDNSHQLSLSKAMDPEIVQQQLQQLLLEAELENPEKVLFLPANDLLQTDASLPLAAEGRLRQALEFDLDRQTPFRSSDVYFDYCVKSRDKVHNLIHLKLYLVPRQLADQHVLNLHQMGIDINRLSANDELQDNTQSINLLPVEMRAQRINYKARFNRLLGLVVLVLLVIAMLQSIRVREQYVDELEDAIASVSKEARMVANMRQQIEDARVGASFLAKRETEFPEDIEVIAELTRILTNDTWLQRLIIKDGEIRVQGLSNESQRLIRDINASEYFAEAAFLGTTQFDSRAQKERFNVSAKLLKIADRVTVEEKTGNVESSATNPESDAKEVDNAVTSS